MKLDWRQGCLYFITIGMESCWLYVSLIALNNWVVSGYFSILWLLLFYLAAFSFNTLLQWLKPRIFLYAANGLIWVTGTLLMVKVQLFSSFSLLDKAWLLLMPQTPKPVILLISASAILWWLGWRLAHTEINFAISVSEFQFGIAILLIVFFVNSLLGIKLANSIPVTLAFFLFSLAGIAITHSQEGKGWLAGSHRSLWSGFLLAGIGLILILGLLIGSLMTPDFLQLILTPFRWIASMVGKGILFLINLFPEPKPVELPSELVPPASPSPDEYETWHKLWGSPLGGWFNTAYSIFIVSVFLWFIWKLSSQLLGWFGRKLANTAGAEVEVMPGALKADILGMLRRLVLSILHLRLMFWRKKAQASYAEVAPVRQIYRRFLSWAAGRGWPRRLSQTPHEYFYTLDNLLTIGHEDLQLITEQYVKARYSPWMPDEKELNQLKQSWKQLRQKRLKQPGNEPNTREVT